MVGNAWESSLTAVRLHEGNVWGLYAHDPPRNSEQRRWMDGRRYKRILCLISLFKKVLEG